MIEIVREDPGFTSFDYMVAVKKFTVEPFSDEVIEEFADSLLNKHNLKDEDVYFWLDPENLCSSGEFRRHLLNIYRK
jgi:hypothetical protein